MIVLVDTKKNSTFAPAIRKGHNAWCVSSAWLECLPVTQEVTGSSPVRTAKEEKPSGFSSFCFSLFARKTAVSFSCLPPFLSCGQFVLLAFSAIDFAAQ